MSRHLVTGAGSGIGAAVAATLAERGDELWLLARSQERADELAGRFPKARFLVGDLGRPEALEGSLRGAELPQRLDSVLHIAGAVELNSVADLTAAELRHQLDVNLVGPAVLTRALLPALRAARGLVLVVNSTAGLSVNPGWAAYAASKFGVRALADTLRAEEAAYGVRVTTVYPSRTATPMQQRVRAQEGAEYDPDAFMRPETVAATIVQVLDLPADATMPEVTLRPAPKASLGSWD